MRDTWPLFAVAAARMLVHLLTNSQYGVHRDELATFDDAHYLAWGYVAYPPLTPFIARVAMVLLGYSLPGVRFFGALALCAAIVFTGLMAREMGGKRLAQVTAALAVAIAPVSILWGALFQYTAFDYLWWVLAAYFTARLLRSEDPRWWLGIGIAVGLGLMTRYTMGFLALGITGAVLLTPARRYLRSPWLWAGVGAAVVIFLPNILWQARHDFISAEFLRYLHARDVRIGRTSDFLPNQFFVPANAFTAPLWAAGLWYYFATPAGKRFRLLGWMFFIPFLMFALAKGRDYYTAGSYPMLFAGGAVWWERLLANRRQVSWLKFAYPLLICLLGAVFAPMLAPVLPVETYIRYQNALGFAPPKTEVGHVGPLPQHFGDRFGWPEMVQQVAQIYNNLPAEERARTGIYANNYGEAGAIDFFGPQYGLPKAISPHQSYYLWGPRDYTGDSLIVLQSKRADAERNCKNVEAVGTVGHPLSMAEEHYTIFICRGLKQPLPELWPRLKHWN